MPPASLHQNQEKKLTQPHVSDRLLLSTAASKLNKFHDDDRAAQKAAEVAAEEAARLRRVKIVSNESEFLRPTTAYIQHHSHVPEPDSAYEVVTNKNLTEFGHASVSYNTKPGTAGFGLGSRPAPVETGEKPHHASAEVSERLMLGTQASKLQGFAAFQANKKKQMMRTPGKRRHMANIASSVYTQKTAAMMAMKKKQSPPKQHRRYSFAPKMYSWGDNPVPKSLKAERRESMPAAAPTAVHVPVPAKTQRWAVRVDKKSKPAAVATSPATEHKSTPLAAHSRGTPQQGHITTSAAVAAAAEKVPSPSPVAARSSSAKKSAKKAAPSPVQMMVQQSPSPVHIHSAAKLSASKSTSAGKKARRRSSGVFGGIFTKSPAVRVPTPKSHARTASSTPDSVGSTSPASVLGSVASVSAGAQDTPEVHEQGVEVDAVGVCPVGSDLDMEAEAQAQEEEQRQQGAAMDTSVQEELQAWESAHLDDEPEPEAKAEAEAEEVVPARMPEPEPEVVAVPSPAPVAEQPKRSRRSSTSGGDTLAGLDSLLNSNMALEILESETERSRMGMSFSRVEDEEQERTQVQVQVQVQQESQQQEVEEEEEVHFELEEVMRRTPRARPSSASKKGTGTPRTAGKSGGSGKKGAKARSSPSTPKTPPKLATFSAASLSMLGSGGSGKKLTGKRSAVKAPLAAAKKLTPVREVYQPNQTVNSHHGIDLDNITQEIAHLLVDSPLVPAYQKAAADVSRLTPPSPTETEEFRSNLRATAADAAHDLSKDYSSARSEAPVAGGGGGARTPSSGGRGGGSRRKSMVPDLDLSPLSPAFPAQTRSSARLAAVMHVVGGSGTPLAKSSSATTPSSSAKKTRKSPRSSAKKSSSK